MPSIEKLWNACQKY